MKKKISFSLFTLVALLVPVMSFAHEAYVLDRSFFFSELNKPYAHTLFAVLKNRHDLYVFIGITVSIILVFTINFVFRQSRAGKKFTFWITKFAPYGKLFVRFAIALSFFFSARSMSFLGPELLLMQLPWAHTLQILLYISSIMIFLGFLTELAALIALFIFCISFFVFGSYLATYLNYLGEILVLLLFGMRTWSIDSLLLGEKKLFQKIKKYETTIVRVLYGTSLMYAAITVKLMHPQLTQYVVQTWDLTQFHWLFPKDPALVALGAGLAEFAIGFFIALGFELRLTVLISLFYITLSLLYFKELVWPHFMLYGISLSLLVQPKIITIDNLLNKKNRVF